MQTEALAYGSVHSSQDIFEAAHFIFVHESAFRPHETSESAYRNCIFLKPLSGVVFLLHTNPGEQWCGFKSVPCRVDGEFGAKVRLNTEFMSRRFIRLRL